MAEEQRCQAPPEGHILCANSCGFFGSPATLNLCSKCYRDHCLKEEQASSAKFAVEKSLAGSSPSPSLSSSASLLLPPSMTLPAAANEVRNPIVLVSTPSPIKTSPIVQSESSTQSNRCTTCRKRVGLTGFRCRCGTTFCGIHRYPEQHGCTFDFKGVGREAIAKANPIVKAAKLEKI